MDTITLTIPRERVELVMAALYGHANGISDHLEAERLLLGSSDPSRIARMNDAKRFLLTAYDDLHMAK